MNPSAPDRAGVTVALCTRNGSRLLPDTMDHILSQEVPDHIPWEVIVVDNGSTDDTARIASDLAPADGSVPYKVVQESRPGVQNARWRALLESRYSFLCITF